MSSKKKRVPQRPEHVAQELRPEKLMFNVTAKERLLLSATAQRLGMQQSELLRRLVGAAISVRYGEGEQLAVIHNDRIVGRLIGL